MGARYTEHTITERIELKRQGYQWWPCQIHNGYWAMSAIGCPECKDDLLRTAKLCKKVGEIKTKGSSQNFDLEAGWDL